MFSFYIFYLSLCKLTGRYFVSIIVISNVNFHFSVLERNKVQFSTKEDGDDVIMDSSEEGIKYSEISVYEHVYM